MILMKQMIEMELYILMKKHGIQKHYKKHDFVFQLHEYVNHLYLLEEGWIKTSKDCGEGRPATLYLYQAGELFGIEEPMAHISQRQKDAYCLTNCSIISIDIQTFFELVKEKPDLFSTISSTLSKQLLYTQHLIEELMSKTVAQRLVSLFLHFSIKKGEQLLVTLPLTHEELSFMIGCSRQTITELLNNWRKQGLIDYQKRQVTIIDSNVLLSVSSFS